jgi:hypothetical protein
MDTRRASGLACVMAVLGLSCTAKDNDAGADAGADGSYRGHCPPPSDIFAIGLGCGSSESPVVKTTGPCTVNSVDPMSADGQSLRLQTNGAGTCHVEMTFGSGATLSVDVNVTSRWRPVGSDPHACGQEFIAVNDAGSDCLPSACEFSIPGRVCDAGL